MDKARQIVAEGMPGADVPRFGSSELDSRTLRPDKCESQMVERLFHLFHL